MLIATAHTRRLPTVALFLALSGTSFSARADDAKRESCVQAYERAQLAARGQDDLAARDHAAACVFACPARLAEDCVQWETQAKSRLVNVQVVLEGAPQGRSVEISVDGAARPDAAAGQVITLPAGEHSFRASAGADESTPVRLRLQPASEPTRITLKFAPLKVVPQERSTSVFPYALGGTGLALLGTGLVLSISGHVDRSDLRSTCAPFCDASAVSSIETRWWAATGVSVVGAALVGVSVWQLLRSPTPPANASTQTTRPL